MEKGQPLGVATLDASGKVPSAQLPSNPGNFLPLAGGTMAGNIDMDGYNITVAGLVQTGAIFTNDIDSLSSEIQVGVPLRLNNNKITGADKGTTNGDVATVDNIQDHNTSPFAHADIRNLISAIQGAYIYRGVINENTVDVTQLSLTNRLTALMSRAPILGDVLTDLDRTDWYFDGTSWDNMGQTFVVLASAVNDGLMSKEDYTKLYDLYTKAQLDAAFALKSDLSYVNAQLALKANIAQEAWITPTLLNGWTGTAKYRKNTIGQIEILCEIYVGTGTVNTTIFNLPSGYFNSNFMTAISVYNADTGAVNNLRINKSGSLTVVETQTTGRRLIFTCILTIE